MSKKKLASNFALRVAVTTIEKIAGVILLPLLVAGLGVEGYGYFALVVSVALVFSNVLTLRLPLAVIRFYPERREEAGPVVLVGLVYWALLVLAVLTPLGLWGERIAAPVFGKTGLARLLALAVSIGLSAMLYEFLTITFRAESRFKFLSFVDGLERIVFVLLCAVAFWWWTPSIEMVCTLLLMTTLAKILAAAGPALKGLEWTWPGRHLVRKMFLFSLPYLPYLASVWLLERSSFFYLQNSAGPATVGAFAIAFSLAAVLESAMGPLQTVLYPLVRKAYDVGDHEHGKELLTMALRMILCAGVFGALTLCLGVRHIFGLLSIHSTPPGVFLLLGLSVAVVLTLVRHVFVTILNLEMNTKVLAWTTPLVAVISLPLYVILIRSFGGEGAALGFLLATTVHTVALARFVPSSLFPSLSRRFALALICSAAVAGVFQWAFSNLSHWQYIVALIFSGLIFVALSFRMGAFTEEEKRIILQFLRIRPTISASPEPEVVAAPDSYESHGGGGQRHLRKSDSRDSYVIGTNGEQSTTRTKGRVHVQQTQRIVGLLQKIPGLRGLRSKARDEITFLRHIWQNGLWREILRRNLRRQDRKHQMPMVLDAAFTLNRESDLSSELQKSGIRFSEGTHAIYIPPQPELSRKLGEFVSFYPEDAGFKVLKNGGAPSEVSYVGQNRSYFWAGALVVGKALDLMPVANLLQALGIGPGLYDLAELAAGPSRLSMFVVEHIPSTEPNQEEWRQFMDKLAELMERKQIMTTTPDWENNDDFAPPDCSHNLVKSEKNGRLYFVDTQNFLIPDYDSYLQHQIRTATKTVHFGHKHLLRGGRYLYQQVPGVKEAGKRDTRTRWKRVKSLLAVKDIKVEGSPVLDIGCNTGMMLAEALNDGALWGIGWDKPEIISHAKSLLGALGYTRHHLVGRVLVKESPLPQDIPPHLYSRLENSIILYLAIRHHIGFIDALRQMPWRALVYEGAQDEKREELVSIIREFQEKIPCTVVDAGNASDGDCTDRPLVLFIRAESSQESSMATGEVEDAPEPLPGIATTRFIS